MILDGEQVTYQIDVLYPLFSPGNSKPGKLLLWVSLPITRGSSLYSTLMSRLCLYPLKA
jgi:hypothetical protein